jgi:hypothetical protein
MGILSEMWVVFGAKTDKLKAGTREAEQTLGKFGQSVNKIGSLIAGAFAVEKIVSFAWEAAKLAGEVQGVKYAFDALNKPGLLSELRKATRGTVSDLDLMKSAVQANNFQIPLEQLGSLLKFAHLRAQQTGQSVDYLVNSIVMGIGRKSPLILDNLGISAVALREKFKGIEVEAVGVADVARAVGEIAEEAMTKSGDAIETTTSTIERMNASWKNTKAIIGETITPLVAKLTVFLEKAARKTQTLFQALKITIDPSRVGMIMRGIEAMNESLDATESLSKATSEIAAVKQKDIKLTKEQIQAQKELADSARIAAEQQWKFSSPSMDREGKIGIGKTSDISVDTSKPALEDATKVFEELEARKQKAFDTTASHAQRSADIILGAFSDVTNIKSFANAVKNAAKQMILAYIAEATAANIAKAVKSGKTWWGALIQGAAAAAGTAAVFSAIPSFAQGGFVKSPTLAMVGDNPSGKGEFILPWEKLNQLGGGAGKYEFKLKGYDLYATLEKQKQHLNRVS